MDLHQNIDFCSEDNGVDEWDWPESEDHKRTTYFKTTQLGDDIWTAAMDQQMRINYRNTFIENHNSFHSNCENYTQELFEHMDDRHLHNLDCHQRE